MKIRQATIADVAERAGVTRSVVSVVLSGHRSTVRVSESTRSRVMQAAREIDYRPSLIARGLQERKSFLLAYLCAGGGSWGVSTFGFSSSSVSAKTGSSTTSAARGTGCDFLTKSRMRHSTAKAISHI